MTILRSVVLFLLAAVAEIGGAWLVWQGVREHRGLLWAGAGVLALGIYGFVATLQPDQNFGRVLAAYGGVFIAGSLLWGVVFDGFRPDRWDIIGSAICLVGVALIMYAPRSADRSRPPPGLHCGRTWCAGPQRTTAPPVDIGSKTSGHNSSDEYSGNPIHSESRARVMATTR